MYFGNQKFLVAGMSRSGEGSVNFLLRRGAKVYMYDDVVSDKVSETMKRLQEQGAVIVTPESLNDAVAQCNVLVLSPGIPIDNPLPVAFRKLGKAIIGEEELAAAYLRAASVAVTGTNGKTTVVSMLDGMLKACNKNAVPCGNYGNPLVNVVEDLGFDSFALLEISSFQLETLFSLRPHIAVITNITEDHLNRHYNMDNYVFLKSKLIRNLRESEYAILNYDDERVRNLAKVTRAKVIWFSALQQVSGAYVDGGSVYFNGERFFGVENLTLGGVHNIYNALVCVAVASLLGLNKEACSDAICKFKGVKHRIQLLGEYGGVTYINDSKGTNVDATLKAVECAARPTILLLGGKDKGYDYTPLFTALNNSRVVHAVLYGENRFRLLDCASRAGYMTFSMCGQFET
ncbi:MAG: UDP-N-acetylmuramoyl-L-alanine--D-glutamate ligase, partial [Clostridia bacterium]|nr:UDP-N-acetylmuramoyl-L-alanine--D-glutamate ligase [Clostridia bacterium]